MRRESAAPASKWESPRRIASAVRREIRAVASATPTARESATDRGLGGFGLERQKDLGADGIWRFIFDAADLVRVKHGAIAILELELYAHHALSS